MGDEDGRPPDGPGAAAPGGSPVQRLHAVYGALPEGERRAAELILDRPGELAFWSASEIAEAAGVSAATISRLVRRLGYGSYDEARKAARSQRAVGSPLYLAGAREVPEAATGQPIQGGLARHLAVEAALLEQSLALINPLTLEAVAGLLARAGRLRLAGFRNSFFVAEYARATLASFRPGVEMLNAPGQTLAEGIAALGPGDAALVVGLRRRPAGFIAVMRALAETGADVVLIADRSVREAPAAARHTLICAVETPEAVDSYLGAMAVTRLVALAVLESLDKAGRRHLQRIERLHETLSELE